MKKRPNTRFGPPARPSHGPVPRRQSRHTTVPARSRHSTVRTHGPLRRTKTGESAAAGPDAEPASRAPKTSHAFASGRAHPGRRFVAARFDRQPAEQGGHVERGPDPGAGGRRPDLHPPVGAPLRRGPRPSPPSPRLRQGYVGQARLRRAGPTIAISSPRIPVTIRPRRC